MARLTSTGSIQGSGRMWVAAKRPRRIHAWGAGCRAGTGPTRRILNHVGIQVCWVYRVHADVILPEFACQACHKPRDRVLRRRVRRHVLRALECLGGSDEDNRAALALRNQGRYSGFDGMPRSREVDVHCFSPGLGADLPRLASCADVGVRNDDIDASELIQTPLEGCVDLVVVTNVGL